MLAHTFGDSAAQQDELMPALDPVGKLLVRLAALQGYAVPLHRFSMATMDKAIELSKLSLLQRALALWQSRFPEFTADQILYEHIERHHFPALWFSHDNQKVLLLRGVLGNKTYVAEDADGQSISLSAREIENGKILVLSVAASADGEETHYPQRSATTYFKLALWRHRRIFIEAVMATFVLSAIGLFAAMYSMQVYDRVLPSKGYSTLWVLTFGVAIAILLEFAMRHLREHMVERACSAIDQELSAVFFGKALDIRLDARPKTIGTFAAQIRQFESVRHFLTSSTLFILADIPFALFFICVIFMIGGWIALVPLLAIPIELAVGFIFSHRIERLTALHMEESNRKNGLLIDAVDGIESIKATGAEWKLLNYWRYVTHTIADSDIQLRSLATLSANWAQMIQQAGYVGLVAAGVYSITLGQLTMGGLIACTIISGRALSPLVRVTQFVVQWKHAKLSLKALNNIMALPGEREADLRLIVPDKCRGELRLENVRFVYDEHATALNIGKLLIRPGERIAIIGSIGSGKSTLLKILGGFYRPSEGKVYLDDIDIANLAPEFVREHIGYLPQEIRLFNGTIRYNLTLGLPSQTDEHLLRAARMTGLDKILRQHPKGLEQELTEGGNGLSGGQRQLVGLTRLLLAQPAIMLLDEPTASMDNQTEKNVLEQLFKALRPESVLVLVTHKTALLHHVDRVVILDNGKIIVDEPRDKVLEAIRKSSELRQQGLSQPAT